MKTILLTGGAGFFGGVLKKEVLRAGHRCVSIDLHADEDEHENLTSVQGDIRNLSTLEGLFAQHKFDVVLHIAAILAHGDSDDDFLWTSNVDGTRNLAECAKRYGVQRLVFTSSNCLWGECLKRAVTEDEPPNPIELYGRSKLEGERILQEYAEDFHVAIIRCPTIIDHGRLGLLAILFEFIDEGRRVWTVGGGTNKYQFIYAGDLAQACMQCMEYDSSDVFHIGSDNVKSLADVFGYVIERAGSGSRIASLPKEPTLLAMRLAYGLKLSPLGPYHYKMIAEDFVFDTAKIKRRLGWQPTLTNEDMLWRAYEYYSRNRREIESRQNVSAHKRPAKMGVIRMLKWVS